MFFYLTEWSSALRCWGEYKKSNSRFIRVKRLLEEAEETPTSTHVHAQPHSDICITSSHTPTGVETICTFLPSLVLKIMQLRAPSSNRRAGTPVTEPVPEVCRKPACISLLVIKTDLTGCIMLHTQHASLLLISTWPFASIYADVGDDSHDHATKRPRTVDDSRATCPLHLLSVCPSDLFFFLHKTTVSTWFALCVCIIWWAHPWVDPVASVPRD